VARHGRDRLSLGLHCLIPTIKKNRSTIPSYDGGADRCYACLALELGKDRNNRTGYAVDVTITRIAPGHQQPTKAAFRISASFASIFTSRVSPGSIGVGFASVKPVATSSLG